MSLADGIDGLKPEDGQFSLVQVEKGEPVGEAGHVLVEFDEADEVEIPPDTDFDSYVVYDREGSTYTRESWPEPFSEAGGPEGKSDADDSGLPGWMAGGHGNY